MSDELRIAEGDSIRAFVQSAADEGLFLDGKVLDYGAGRCPYRDIVENGGGIYHPYDGPDYPASVCPEWLGHDDGFYPLVSLCRWRAILCTQVLQYLRDPLRYLRDMHDALAPGGHLVLTYPTHWPEVEPDDLHRFTKAGMERMLKEAGFEIVRHDWRHGFRHEGNSFAVGYGVIARANGGKRA